MSDIQALEILSQVLKSVSTLPDPPTNKEGIDAFTASVKKTRNDVQKALVNIKEYVENINAKIAEVRKANELFLQQSQDSLVNIFSQLKHAQNQKAKSPQGKGQSQQRTRHTSSSGGRIAFDNIPSTTDKVMRREVSVEEPSTIRNNTADKLELALELQQAMKELMDDRLDELIKETEIALDKAKNGIYLTSSDIDNLIACVDSWKHAKVESFAEEKKNNKQKNNVKKTNRKDRQKRQERKKNEQSNKKERIRSA